MCELEITKVFKKDLRSLHFSNKHYARYILYLGHLLKEEPLPPEARDHPLQGEWSEYREFHISGDLLVIYKKVENKIYLARIGTHAQLFKE